MSAKDTLCRQPVVAIVGHIDHGKTTLLDYIRKTSVVDKEAGGITQRVSAYETIHKGAEGVRAITFIDTPGHEAFQKMRRRAGAAADIAILIVASDDGVKPQTIEAHKAIADAGIPFIVAFTKADKDTANIDKAKESVMKQGIYLEGLGGEVPWVSVSGKSGAGVPELLDLIILVADLQNISCDTEKPVEAVVIESTRDARSGVSATLIVKQGTMKVGGFAVSGSSYAPLRAIENYAGEKVSELSCGKPARITGFTEEPTVGATLITVETKKEAEKMVAENKVPVSNERTHAEKEDENKVTLRIALKADTVGSLEALEYEIGKINKEKVEMLIASRGIGAISENDVKPLIGFSPAMVLGFNVKVEASSKDLADRQGIIVETRSIIYELADWLKEEVKKHEPELPADTVTGTANILKHFSTAGSKHVIGGKVQTGVLRLNDRVTIIRRGVEVSHGRIVNLQAQKADVSSVPEGMEFGAQIDTKADIISGDTISASPNKHN